MLYLNDVIKARSLSYDVNIKCLKQQSIYIYNLTKDNRAIQDFEGGT